LFLARLLGTLANSNENYRRYNFQGLANISGNFRKISAYSENINSGKFTILIICNYNSNVTCQCVLLLFLLKLKITLLDLFIIFIPAHHKASFASVVYATGGITVCLSICLSHSGIMSKSGNAEGCSLYHRTAQCLWFSDVKSS